MKEKVIVSMTDLSDFADMLVKYGRGRDYVEIENCGLYLKSIFFGEDEFIKNDIKEFLNGAIEYR